MQLAQMLGEAKDELDALKQNNNDLRGAMINAIKVGVMFDACLVHRIFFFGRTAHANILQMNE